MTISINRIHTKDEIREMLEIWLKYRPDQDYDFRLDVGICKFDITPERVRKLEE